MTSTREYLPCFSYVLFLFCSSIPRSSAWLPRLRGCASSRKTAMSRCLCPTSCQPAGGSGHTERYEACHLDCYQCRWISVKSMWLPLLSCYIVSLSVLLGLPLFQCSGCRPKFLSFQLDHTSSQKSSEMPLRRYQWPRNPNGKLVTQKAFHMLATIVMIDRKIGLTVKKYQA